MGLPGVRQTPDGPADRNTTNFFCWQGSIREGSKLIRLVSPPSADPGGSLLLACRTKGIFFMAAVLSLTRGL